MQASLISSDYARLNADLHRTNPSYGTSSARHAGFVRSIADRFGCRTVLDYGCGKGALRQSLGFTLDVREYDPAIEGKNERPDPADLVACTDVLEHIEPDCLDAVLDDLRRVTRKAGVFIVSTVPSKKTLADGRNAHLIVEPYTWWLPKLWDRFGIAHFEASKTGFAVVCHGA
jgi:2-polyprenyl-3-methyl-5-hydroxy-6-metoxy-1,4-benzoquinol methylase